MFSWRISLGTFCILISYLIAFEWMPMSVQAGPIAANPQIPLTNLAKLELSLLPPDPPDLKCEILAGDERYYPRDPRPQIACYADKRGIFFVKFDYEGRWVNLENTFVPSLAYGKVMTSAALLQVTLIVSDGTMAQIEFTVENELYSLYCVEPLCMRI